jgi:ceramide glucosyltransferase
VRGLGSRVVVSRAVVGHACAEPTLRALVQHELRWARTVRALDPRGYAGSIVTHPLPLAIVALLCAVAAGGGLVVGALLVVGLALATRTALGMTVDAGLQIKHHRAWLGPVRDILSFFEFVGGFFVAAIVWRGRRYRVAADGTVVALVEY